MVSVKILCFFINKVISLEPNCNKDFLLCFICTLVWILFYRHTSNNIHKKLLTAAFYRSVVQIVEEKKSPPALSNWFDIEVFEKASRMRMTAPR